MIIDSTLMLFSLLHTLTKVNVSNRRRKKNDCYTNPKHVLHKLFSRKEILIPPFSVTTGPLCGPTTTPGQGLRWSDPFCADLGCQKGIPVDSNSRNAIRSASEIHWRPYSRT